MYRKAVFASLAFVVLCFVSSAAHAGTVTLNFSTGTFQQTGIGSVPPGGPFDILSVTARTGTVTLAPGVPITAAINGFTFTVGDTGEGSLGLLVNSAAPRSMTLGGVTMTITQPFTVLIGETADTLTFQNGPTVSFNLGALGIVDVTPLGLAPIVAPIGVTTGTLNATFVLRGAGTAIPEQTTMLLLGTGLVGVGAAVRKRRTANKG